MSSLFFHKVDKVPTIQKEFIIRERVNKETDDIELILIRNPQYNKDGNPQKDKENGKEVIVHTISRKEYIDDLIEEIHEIEELTNF